MLIQLPIAFRLCREDELPALEWMGLFTRQREIIAQAFADQQRGEGAMLLAICNDFPVGQVWLDFANRGTRQCPRLWAVRVFPPMQGAGLGSRLMREAEALALARGAERAELGVEPDNPKARRFYERLAYAFARHETEEVRYSFEGQPLSMSIEQDILTKRLRPP